MVIDSVVDLYGEEDNVHYCRMGTSMFVRGYGGWNVSCLSICCTLYYHTHTDRQKK